MINFMRLFILLIATLICSVQLAAKEPNWDKSIQAVESLKNKFEMRAKELGWQCCLGTAYNEFMVPEHRCSILGRMLEKKNFIKHLEKPQPGRGASADDYALAAHSLENWLINLNNLRSLSNGERIKTWNLDCVGKLNISASSAISEIGISSTFYSIDNDGEMLRILGDVEIGFFDKLREALDKNSKVKYVALGSGGGLVREAILAGYEIRKRGLETTVWNNCYSACPLVFIGGIERTIWSPYPDLGFHQIYDSRGPISFDSPTYDVVRRYANDMGVNSDGLLLLMSSAAPSEMRNASPDQLCNYRIATWIQRNCFAK